MVDVLALRTPSDASPAFKQELELRRSASTLNSARRLRGVLRDNPDLDVESQEFQDIVTKESEYLMKQERFQISYQVWRRVLLRRSFHLGKQ